MDFSKIHSTSTLDPQAVPIGKHEAIHVLWEYGFHERTCSGGGFIEKLIAAIAKADGSSRARLALGFPSYVAACNLIERSPSGAVTLRQIADQP